MNKRKLICVVGPTASGKTGLGVALAKKFDGEIVSADSRQIFRKLDIGTGKDLIEYGDVPYHLIDILDAGDAFTMFDWLEHARVALDDIWKRGKLPIVVGGTGLYVKALIQGFNVEKFEIRMSNDEVKDEITNIKRYSREELEGKSKEELQEILIDLDEEAFLTVDLNNPYRLVRAIEKAQSGERVIKTKPDFEYLLIGAERPREELHKRIDLRVDERFDQGMLQEVQGLLDSGVDSEWLLSLGLEYRIIGDYVLNNQNTDEAVHSKDCRVVPLFESEPEGSSLRVEWPCNDKGYDEMVQELKWKIHQYARRQVTWWRRFDVHWADNVEIAEKLVSDFLKS